MDPPEKLYFCPAWAIWWGDRHAQLFWHCCLEWHVRRSSITKEDQTPIPNLAFCPIIFSGCGLTGPPYKRAPRGRCKAKEKNSRVLKRNLPTSGALWKLHSVFTSLHHRTGEEERGGRSYIQTQFAQVGSDFKFTYSLSDVRSVPGENGRYESMLVIRNVWEDTTTLSPGVFS